MQAEGDTTGQEAQCRDEPSPMHKNLDTPYPNPTCWGDPEI